MLKAARNLFYAVSEDLFPSPIPPWVRIAQRELGVREFRGGENARILKYWEATRLKVTEDEVPWCSAFINWVMQQAHMQRSYAGNARSWLSIGKPLPGFRKYAIVVFARGEPWQGHVALAMEDLGDQIRVIGGNQSDSVCYARYSKSTVVGYREPQPADSGS